MPELTPLQPAPPEMSPPVIEVPAEVIDLDNAPLQLDQAPPVAPEQVLPPPQIAESAPSPVVISEPLPASMPVEILPTSLGASTSLNEYVDAAIRDTSESALTNLAASMRNARLVTPVSSEPTVGLQ